MITDAETEIAIFQSDSERQCTKIKDYRQIVTESQQNSILYTLLNSEVCLYCTDIHQNFYTM